MKQVQIFLEKSRHFKNEKSLFVKFPYNPEYVSRIKSLPMRYYHPISKMWEVPQELEEQLYKVFEIENTVKKFVPINKDKLIENIQLPELKTKQPLFAHQIQAIKFGLYNNSFLLADEMGLGKTATTIHYALVRQQLNSHKHCLIIAGINELKFNWLAEIENHSYSTGKVLGSRVNKKGKIVIDSQKSILEDLQKVPEEYFWITNIESIRNADILAEIKNLINHDLLDMIVIDEAQVIKNPASQQGKAFLQLKPKTKVALTGTPIMNNPLESFPILTWLGQENHSFWQFKQMFCIFGGYLGKEVVGYKNLDILQKKLDKIMLRRLKNDLLDLPKRTFTTEYLQMNSKQMKIYEEVRIQLLQEVDLIKADPNPLARFTRLRQATADTSLLSSSVFESVKIERIKQIAEELIENGKSFAVFSVWSKMIDKIVEALDFANPAKVTGEVKNKFAEIQKFENDKNCHCIIGTVGAMGTGYNLTKASTVIFADSPWNFALKSQAADRLYRIGQKNNVNVITLVCKDTIDEKIEQIVDKKGEISKFLVGDGIIDKENRSKLVDILLS